MEALVWGFAFTYGVFQAYYTEAEEFRNSSNIVAIGTCAMGIMYLDIPLVFRLCLLKSKRMRPRLRELVWVSIGYACLNRQYCHPLTAGLTPI
ncbi:hypothetical protein BJX64DRAFT_251272 [Aspergillus heterothallicus]